MDDAPADRLDTGRAARALLVVGAAVTAGTGIGLFGWPEETGRHFAWVVRAPLTAAWMGGWYLAASLALASALRERSWLRARVVVVVALSLTTLSLIETARFHELFRFTDGSAIEMAIAWTWLVVYVALPPAALAVLVAQERRLSPADRVPTSPLHPATRAVLGCLACTAAVVGLWLTVHPAGLIEVWPWRLIPLTASVVGSWLLTLAIGLGWVVGDGDWRRGRIALGPLIVGLGLQLVALARLHGTRTGSGASAVVYAVALAAALAVLVACAVTEERRR